MSFIHDLPYLGAVNHGAALRTKATKLQSYAELNEARGGTFGKDKLAPFFADQKARLNEDHGLPSDGLNLWVPGLDPRVECYRVLSAIRLNPADDNKAAWNAFCDYFTKRWSGVKLVTSVSFAANVPTAVSVGSSITCGTSVLPADADDKSLVFTSSDTSKATVAPGTNGAVAVTGVAEGTVTVTATAKDGSGRKANLVITVTAAAASKNGAA